MAVIAFLNRKGGVAKSSSVAHVAAAIARRLPKIPDRPVLVVDCDSQGHAGKHLGVEPSTRPHLGTVLYDGMPATEAVVDTSQGGVKIIRGSRDLRDFDFTIGMELGEQRARGLASDEWTNPYGVLKGRLDTLREHYSQVLVDCPPGAGMLHLNIYRWVDYVVTPSEADAGAIEGIMDLLEELEEARQSLGAEVRMLGVFFTRVAGFTREHRENMREIADALGDVVLKPYVRTATKMREAWRERLLISEHDTRRGGVTEDYEEITTEILRRIKVDTTGRR